MRDRRNPKLHTSSVPPKSTSSTARQRGTPRSTTPAARVGTHRRRRSPSPGAPPHGARDTGSQAEPRTVDRSWRYGDSRYRTVSSSSRPRVGGTDFGFHLPYTRATPAVHRLTPTAIRPRMAKEFEPRSRGCAEVALAASDVGHDQGRVDQRPLPQDHAPPVELGADLGQQATGGRGLGPFSRTMPRTGSPRGSRRRGAGPARPPAAPG